MSKRDELPTLTELRGHLRDAARREMAEETRGSPARLRRVATVAVAVLLLVAGAAGAASLLATGSPVSEPDGKSARYLPARVNATRVAVSAADPQRQTTWGVAPYTARDGRPCALAGEVRLGRLGIVSGGRFHPYAANTGGPCGDLDRIAFFGDQRTFGGSHPRTLVFGRARPNLSGMTLELDGRRYIAKTGRDGAFLFVFDGAIPPSDLKLSPRS